MRIERGRKKAFNSVFFESFHTIQGFYDALEMPAGPIQAEVRGLLAVVEKVFKSLTLVTISNTTMFS